MKMKNQEALLSLSKRGSTCLRSKNVNLSLQVSKKPDRMLQQRRGNLVVLLGSAERREKDDRSGQAWIPSSVDGLWAERICLCRLQTAISGAFQTFNTRNMWFFRIHMGLQQINPAIRVPESGYQRFPKEKLSDWEFGAWRNGIQAFLMACQVFALRTWHGDKLASHFAFSSLLILVLSAFLERFKIFTQTAWSKAVLG